MKGNGSCIFFGHILENYHWRKGGLAEKTYLSCPAKSCKMSTNFEEKRKSAYSLRRYIMDYGMGAIIAGFGLVGVSRCSSASSNSRLLLMLRVVEFFWFFRLLRMNEETSLLNENMTDPRIHHPAQSDLRRGTRRHGNHIQPLGRIFPPGGIDEDS